MSPEEPQNPLKPLEIRYTKKQGKYSPHHLMCVTAIKHVFMKRVWPLLADSGKFPGKLIVFKSANPLGNEVISEIICLF